MNKYLWPRRCGAFLGFVLSTRVLSISAADFTAVDVGIVQPPGVVAPIGNGYSISTVGTNIGGTADQFTFNYQTAESNFDWSVRIESLTPVDVWSKAALLARDTLLPGSRFVGVVATPTVGGCVSEERDVTGGAAVSQGFFPVNYPNTWLRLARTNNLFTTYASGDGQSWTILSTVTLGLSNTVYLGVGASSFVKGRTNVVQYRDFAVSAGGTVGPVTFASEPLGPSSRKTPFAISEILYNPAGTNGSTEFVELYNSNPFLEDLSGYRISGSVDFTFPANTTLPGGGFLVVARDPAAVRTRYPDLTAPLFGPWDGAVTNNLPNGTGVVRLRNKEGAILLEVPYSNQRPWPVAADGTGHSLVLARPSYGEGYPEAWDISDQIGGSPGRADTMRSPSLRAVRINEILAHTESAGTEDYIELYNHSNEPSDISGCVLSDTPTVDRYVIPTNSVIPPRGFMAFTQTQLGFGLDAAGETVFFKSADRTRVLDALQYEAQADGVAYGRFPDGGPEFYPLQSQTPGTANAAPAMDDVVINEIMYKPITGNNDDEYVELYNRGTNIIDLSQWKFTDGISFTFPSNTFLAGDGYLVIAKSATNLIAHYANLTSQNTLGDYGGSLGNGGDRVALAQPASLVRTNATNALVLETNLLHVVVDEVTYRVGGKWGHWANEGGSSLELIDARANHRLAGNWADSDDTAKSSWTSISVTNFMDNGQASPSTIEIQLFGEGECLVDNIELRNLTGSNFVSTANSTFESGLGNWIPRGTMVRSSIENTGYNSSKSLHIRASARGDTGANRILCPLTSTPAGFVVFKAQVRWLRGWPEFYMRLHGNAAEAVGRLGVPPDLGTPGARNSRAVANAGPAIYAVAHNPPLPARNQPVVVTARVEDPDGLSSVLLNYRIDPSPNLTSIAMRDDGLSGDAVAGDGIYSAILPGQATNLVAFHIVATDHAGKPAITKFPAEAPTRECLVLFGDTTPASSFATYHMWMTAAGIQSWINRPVMSNERVDGTFVYGNYRVIYGFGAKYAGSPYHQGFASPVSSDCHFSLEFPLDDLLLGTENFNKLHSPGNSAFDDDSLQREQTGYWMARQLGLPWNYRRYIAVYVNGNRKGGSSPQRLMEDTQTPGTDVIDEWFPNDSNGNLYKLQPWFEMDDAATGAMGFVNESWLTLNKYPTIGGAHKLARYRWNFLTRAGNGTANDYGNVFALVDAANAPVNTPTFIQGMEALADMDQWIRTFAIEHAVGNWDSVGYDNEQNMYGYKPTQGKWTLFIWDYNILLGNSGSHGPDGSHLFTVNAQGLPGQLNGDTNMQKVLKTPHFRRMYLRNFRDIINGPMNLANLSPVLDAKYAAFVANGVNVASPANIKGFVTAMVTSLRAALTTEGVGTNINFVINGSQEFSTNSNLVVISGLAPLDLDRLRVNGVEYPITWETVSRWSLRVVLTPGANSFEIQGYDRSGNSLTNGPQIMTITYTGSVSSPEESVVFSEIMYHPTVTNATYLELFNHSSDSAFDLSGWRINGLGYTFPPWSIVSGQQTLVVAKDRPTFAAAYGAGVPVFDEFSGDLDPEGETLTLERAVIQRITNGPVVVTNLTYVDVDKVRYENKAPWIANANGGGASLQVIDPAQDNARVSNWTDAGGWRLFSTNLNPGSSVATNLYLFLDAAGDVYLDDLSFVATSGPTAGINIVQNGDFESPLDGVWNATGNQSNTVVSTVARHAGNQALHLIASGAGGPFVANGFWQTVPTITNTVYTVTLWYLPTTNANRLTVRLNSVFRPDIIVKPGHLFSPAAPTPTPAVLPAYDRLWLNEVQVINALGPVDGHGQHDPWVEIFNSGATPLNLSGYFLADNYGDNLLQWQFPLGATLAPGEFKLVWLDGQSDQTTASEWHANFRLTGSSGQVALSRIAGIDPQITDYLTYTNLTADSSYGDFPDGQPFTRAVFRTPTPGGTNNARLIHVFINEWMAANTNFLADPADGHFDDWFELYNAGDEMVDLGGYYLTDNLGNRNQFQIPTNGQYVIPPGGFLLVWADNQPEQNTNNRPDLHVNFQLAKSGESLALFAPDGHILIDTVEFGVQTNDVSEGRFPDGAANGFFVLMPTPAASNKLADGTTTLGISGISRSADQVSIRFQAETGKHYRVEFKEDLNDAAWQTLGADVSGSGVVVTATDTVGVQPHRFYRIVRLD